MEQGSKGWNRLGMACVRMEMSLGSGQDVMGQCG